MFLFYLALFFSISLSLSLSLSLSPSLSLCLSHTDDKMYDIDLTVTPRVIDKEALLPFKKVNAGMCGPDGVKIFVDEDFYRYETPQVLAFSRIRPEPHKISREFLGCEH